MKGLYGIRRNFKLTSCSASNISISSSFCCSSSSNFFWCAYWIYCSVSNSLSHASCVHICIAQVLILKNKVNICPSKKHKWEHVNLVSIQNFRIYNFSTCPVRQANFRIFYWRLMNSKESFIDISLFQSMWVRNFSFVNILFSCRQYYLMCAGTEFHLEIIALLPCKLKSSTCLVLYSEHYCLIKLPPTKSI